MSVTMTVDFSTCSCGAVSVDGGIDYIRRCGELEDYEELSVFEESEELRQEVIKKYKRESDEEAMLKKIEEKLGFSIKEYNDRHRVKKEAHEQDNIPNPYERTKENIFYTISISLMIMVMILLFFFRP